MVSDVTKVWTIGHSTRSIDDFIEALAAEKIEALIDVRRFPVSRRYPHFNKDELAQSLAAAGIAYLHLPELGGRRNTRKDSHNTGLRNASFRGYADYMETDSFRLGIKRLLGLASAHRSAIMCAEALWWRCHRSLISDYLMSNGIEVIHIAGAGKSEVHHYTSAARIIDGELSYRPLL